MASRMPSNSWSWMRPGLHSSLHRPVRDWRAGAVLSGREGIFLFLGFFFSPQCRPSVLRIAVLCLYSGIVPVREKRQRLWAARSSVPVCTRRGFVRLPSVRDGVFGLFSDSSRRGAEGCCASLTLGGGAAPACIVRIHIYGCVWCFWPSRPPCPDGRHTVCMFATGRTFCARFLVIFSFLFLFWVSQGRWKGGSLMERSAKSQGPYGTAYSVRGQNICSCVLFNGT